jgi:hypothetical protein
MFTSHASIPHKKTAIQGVPQPTCQRPVSVMKTQRMTTQAIQPEAYIKLMGAVLVFGHGFKQGNLQTRVQANKKAPK